MTATQPKTSTGSTLKARKFAPKVKPPFEISTS